MKNKDIESIFSIQKFESETSIDKPLAKIVPIRQYIPETLTGHVNKILNKEREDLIAALSEVEIPSIMDNSTGAILEFPGFRPFLNSIIQVIKEMNNTD